MLHASTMTLEMPGQEHKQNTNRHKTIPNTHKAVFRLGNTILHAHHPLRLNLVFRPNLAQPGAGVTSTWEAAALVTAQERPR